MIRGKSDGLVNPTDNITKRHEPTFKKIEKLPKIVPSWLVLIFVGIMKHSKFVAGGNFENWNDIRLELRILEKALVCFIELVKASD